MTVYNTQIGDSPLARLHFQITTRPGKLPHFDPDKIEAELAAAARSWADHLQDELTERYGEDHAQSVCSCYGKAFPSGYMEQFGAEAAVSDIAKVEEALGRDELAMDLYRPKGTGPTEVRFKVFHPNEPVPLSDMLPMLENMGLKVIDEIPHAVRPLHYDNRMVMIHDLGLIMRDGSRISLNTIRDKFQTAFFRVWCGDMESDGFNALIIKAGLDFRGVIVIRAYAKYLRQAAIP
jgi:glutamate dehydrogenase